MWRLLPLLGAACGAGALGQTLPTARCPPGDVSCIARGLDGPIAIGASMRPEVHVALRGGAAPAVRLLSARPAVVEARDGALAGVAEGLAAVLVVDEDDTVIDFFHVRAARATALAVHRLGPDGSDRGAVSDVVALVVGESAWVGARLRADAQALLGHADLAFESSSESVEVLRDGAPDARRLHARAPGEAVVRVSGLGLEGAVRLRVVP